MISRLRPTRDNAFTMLLGFLLLGATSCSAPRANVPGPRDPDASREFTKTKSGLRYRILRKADGPKPTAEDSVTVNYKGWLDDQTVFDSSYKRGEPTSFALKSVVKGWTEGLQYCNEGGMIELYIPSSLAYGPQGNGQIPGGSDLHFIVELISIDSN